MTDNEHAGERVLLYILVGIGIFGLAYLFFKDQFKRQDTSQLSSLSSLSSLSGLGRTTSQLALSNPRIDELERQTVDLETQTNSLKEKLKMYDYQINQLSSGQYKNGQGQSDNSKLYQLSGQPSRAGSIMTLKTSTEDKIRQKDFGMN